MKNTNLKLAALLAALLVLPSCGGGGGGGNNQNPDPGPGTMITPPGSDDTADDDGPPAGHVDEPDTMAAAKTISSGQTITGYLEGPDDVDYFELPLPEGINEITFSLDAPTGTKVTVMDQYGNVLGTGTTASETIVRTGLDATEKFLIAVEHAASGKLSGKAAKARKYLLKISKATPVRYAELVAGFLSGESEVNFEIDGISSQVVVRNNLLEYVFCALDKKHVGNCKIEFEVAGRSEVKNPLGNTIGYYEIKAGIFKYDGPRCVDVSGGARFPLMARTEFLAGVGADERLVHQKANGQIGHFTVPECGIKVSESALTVAEAGGTATYTVVLESNPGGGTITRGSVTVDVASNDTDAATVSPKRLTFNEANWKMPQRVTVTGVNDDIDNPGEQRTATISHTVKTTGHLNPYKNVGVADVAVTVTDDDDSSGSGSGSGSGNTGGYAQEPVLNPAPGYCEVIVSEDSNDVTRARGRKYFVGRAKMRGPETDHDNDGRWCWQSSEAWEKALQQAIDNCGPFCHDNRASGGECNETPPETATCGQR